jgi:hypothetical protein
METGSDMKAMRPEAARLVIVGALGGVLAGIVLALTEMIYGWASSAHTAWDAPMGIWAWIAGLNYFGAPGNHIWPILLGLGGHMVNSMLAGVLFVALLSATRLRTYASSLVLAVAYGFVLWVIMRYGILPLRDSTKTLFTTSAISPQWVWWLAHGLFGITLGGAYVMLSRVRMRPPALIQHLREEERRAAA